MLLVYKYCFPTKVESNTKGCPMSVAKPFAKPTSDDNLQLSNTFLLSCLKLFSALFSG